MAKIRPVQFPEGEVFWMDPTVAIETVSEIQRNGNCEGIAVDPKFFHIGQ